MIQNDHLHALRTANSHRNNGHPPASGTGHRDNQKLVWPAVKAVLFDQDGLMFGTEEVSSRAWRTVGARHGIVVEESFLSVLRGRGVGDVSRFFSEHFGDSLDFDSILAQKQEYFRREIRTNGLPVKEGLTELLCYLKDHSVKTAMATSSPREWSAENLEIAGISEYFDACVFGDTVARCKPEPDIFLAAAEALSEEPGSCLVLEDSLNGIEAANRGGFPVIMVPDLTPPNDEVRGKTLAVCSSLLEVKRLFEEGRFSPD